MIADQAGLLLNIKIVRTSASPFTKLLIVIVSPVSEPWFFGDHVALYSPPYFIIIFLYKQPLTFKARAHCVLTRHRPSAVVRHARAYWEAPRFLARDNLTSPSPADTSSPCIVPCSRIKSTRNSRCSRPLLRQGM